MEEERRPRGELARWRDEPQLLAILGTDRDRRAAQQVRSPHRGRPSYFDVAQRGRYEISSCTSFTSSLSLARLDVRMEGGGGLTNDRYLSIFDDAPFEGPSLARPATSSSPRRRPRVTCRVRGGEQFCQDRIFHPFHPSIYPVVQRWWMNRNQGRIQSAVVPALPHSSHSILHSSEVKLALQGCEDE